MWIVRRTENFGLSPNCPSIIVFNYLREPSPLRNLYSAWFYRLGRSTLSLSNASHLLVLATTLPWGSFGAVVPLLFHSCILGPVAGKQISWVCDLYVMVIFAEFSKPVDEISRERLLETLGPRGEGAVASLDGNFLLRGLFPQELYLRSHPK